MERFEVLTHRDIETLRQHKKTGGNVTIKKDRIYSLKACTRRITDHNDKYSDVEVVIPATKVQEKINEIRKIGLAVVHHEPNAEPCDFAADLWDIWNTGYGNQEVVSLRKFKELFTPAKKHNIEKFSDFTVMYSEHYPDQVMFGLAYDGNTDTVVLFE